MVEGLDGLVESELLRHQYQPSGVHCRQGKSECKIHRWDFGDPYSKAGGSQAETGTEY